MNKKDKALSADKKYNIPDNASNAEKFLRKIFRWISDHRKLILLSFIGIMIIIIGLITISSIKQNKKSKIVTAFYSANKDYAEKLQKGNFDLDSIGTTMKALREITEMSKSVEESLVARYFLGILHYNVGRSENKPGQFTQARDYWLVVAEQTGFAFAPQALLAISSSYEELNKSEFYERAIQFYEVVLRRYPNTIFAYRAFYKMGICYIKLNKKDLAISNFKKIPRYIGDDAQAKRDNYYYTQAQYYISMLENK